MAYEGVGRPDGVLFVRHRDVDVQSIVDLEPGEGAQLLLHPHVAPPAGEPLGEGVGEGVQPGGRDSRPRLTRRPRDLAPERGELPAQLRDGREHRGAHLDAVFWKSSGAIRSDPSGAASSTASMAGASSWVDGSISWNSSSKPTVCRELLLKRVCMPINLLHVPEPRLGDNSRRPRSPSAETSEPWHTTLAVKSPGVTRGPCYRRRAWRGRGPRRRRG